MAILAIMLLLQGPHWIGRLAGQPDGGGALIDAALRSDTDGIENALAEGAIPDWRDGMGNTALLWSADLGNEAAIARLIEAGANVSAVSDLGVSPLFCAVIGNHMGAARLLLEHGADPNDLVGRTGSALYLAVAMNRREFDELLLGHGADPNLTAGGLEGLLEVAAQWGPDSGQIIRLLLAAPAHP